LLVLFGVVLGLALAELALQALKLALADRFAIGGRAAYGADPAEAPAGARSSASATPTPTGSACSASSRAIPSGSRCC
jgi:hypothetical protein